MTDRKLFTHLQVGVAGILGSPLAAAALTSWNLGHRSKWVGLVFLVVFFALLVLMDSAAGAIGSATLGVFGFLVLLLAVMLVNYLASPARADLSAQSWIMLLPVVVVSLLVCVMFRHWISGFISFA